MSNEYQLPDHLMPLAEMVATYFFEKEKWPLLRDFYRRNIPDAEKQVHELHQYMTGMDMHIRYSADLPVMLNIEILSQLRYPQARQFARDYAEFVEFCANKYTQSNASLMLSSTELLTRLLDSSQSNQRQSWINTFVNRLLYVFLSSAVESPSIYKSLGSPSSMVWTMEVGDSIVDFLNVHSLDTYLATRRSIIDSYKQPTISTLITSPLANTVSTVFLVHGHDHERRDHVKLALEQMGLQVIILMNEPYQGRFTLQKFEEEAGKADFAVIVVTADDLAVAKNTLSPEIKSIQRQKLHQRGRQNVIWEWGYLYHKFGSDRVCVLIEPGIEVPSDLFGLGYVELDASWQAELQKEIEAARTKGNTHHG